MEKYIEESRLSSTTTNILRNMGITEISQLKEHNIKTFASLHPTSYEIAECPYTVQYIIFITTI